MKKVLVTACLCVLPVATTQAASGYIEGHVGRTSISDVTSQQYNFPSSGNVNLRLDYENPINYGIEIGVANLTSSESVRVGVSWTSHEAKLRELNGFIGGGTTVPASTTTFNRAQLRTQGYDVDNETGILAINLYYDFPTDVSLKPYVGVGYGVAYMDIADSKSNALTFTLGAKFQISRAMTLGARYQLTRIDDFEEDFGFQFHGIRPFRYSGLNSNSFSVTLGYGF